MASRLQSHGGRPVTGSREFQFYISKSPEINRRYAGKHVAIVGDKVVAAGRSPIEVWDKARKLYPKSKPLLAYVPKRDALVLIIG